MANWSQIKKEYVTGNESLTALAEKHETSLQQMKKHSAAENWKKQREAYRDAKTVREIQATADKEIERYKKILDVSDLLLEKIKKALTELSDDDLLIVNPKSIKALSGAIKDIKDIQGVRNEDDKIEQQARIQKLLKEAETEQNDNKEIVIKIEGDKTSWQV